MSDVSNENSNKQSGWTSALILGGTVVGAFFALPIVVAHLALVGVAAAGAGIYAATSEKRRDTTVNLFKSVTKAYKEAFSNAFGGFRKAEKWAETREAARKASAPDATGGTSAVASKEAGASFNNSATGAKVTVSANENTPAAKPKNLSM